MALDIIKSDQKMLEGEHIPSAESLEAYKGELLKRLTQAGLSEVADKLDSGQVSVKDIFHDPNIMIELDREKVVTELKKEAGVDLDDLITELDNGTKIMALVGSLEQKKRDTLRDHKEYANKFWLAKIPNKLSGTPRKLDIQFQELQCQAEALNRVISTVQVEQLNNIRLSQMENRASLSRSQQEQKKLSGELKANNEQVSTLQNQVLEHEVQVQEKLFELEKLAKDSAGASSPAIIEKQRELEELLYELKQDAVRDKQDRNIDKYKAEINDIAEKAKAALLYNDTTA